MGPGNIGRGQVENQDPKGLFSFRWLIAVPTAESGKLPSSRTLNSTPLSPSFTRNPASVHDGTTNRLASLSADHKFSNLAALFPANADPGLARLILDQTVNRSVAELLQVESLRG